MERQRLRPSRFDLARYPIKNAADYQRARARREIERRKIEGETE